MMRSFWRWALAAVVCTALCAGARAQQATAVDYAKLSEEAQGWLQGLVRINTIYPPGNELAAAKYLAGILEKEGITTQVIEYAPGRGIVIAHLHAGAVPDPARALLLVGHTDVVGVDRGRWKEDPFAGLIKDGTLWGRGTVDDKGPLIINLAVFIALKRGSVRLDRDVILLAEGGEETSGDGIDFAIEKHWDKIAAGFAINEGGRTIVRDGKVFYVGVQASEKVSVNVAVIATGPSGHASIPRKDNAVVHLAEAIAKIGAWETPAKPNTVTRRYFEQLASIEDPENGKWMRALEQPERMAQAARHLSEANLVWSSMLRTSISPTILVAGVGKNVIPAEARANLNIRLLPGESLPELIEEMKKLVDDPQIRFEAEAITRQPAPPSALDSDLYRSFERATHIVFPGAATLPLMSTWATDSAYLRLRNVQCYGLVPMPLTEEEIGRMHAEDERVPLAALRKGLEYVYVSVEHFVRAK